MCPRTEIVTLASPSFYYGYNDRKAYREGRGLAGKVGSFQGNSFSEILFLNVKIVFLKGYKDATTFFKEGYAAVSSSSTNDGSTESLDSSHNPSNWSETTKKEFQLGIKINFEVK